MPLTLARGLKPWHNELMERIVAGQTFEEISVDMKVAVSYLKVVADSPLFQTEIAKIREAHFKVIGERLESYSHEALDTIVEKMRNAKQDAIQLQAAKEILDRSGYVKVDKTMSVVADAEKVIRELGRLKGINDGTGNVDGSVDGESVIESVGNGENGTDLDTGRDRSENPRQSFPEDEMDPVRDRGVAGQLPPSRSEV